MTTQRTVLVTGATAGIGRLVALRLAERGLKVIATGRREERLVSLAQEAGDHDLHGLRLDVTNAESIREVAEQVDELTGGRGIDVLINNAGYGMAAPMIETTDADMRHQFETNVFGLMAVTRAFVPAMMKRGSGRVINVSSIGGLIAFPMFGAYTASKHAVEAISDALRLELAGFGIQVSVIEPGPIKTEFAETTMSHVDRYSDASSPFAAVYERAQEMKKQTDAQSVSPECVARAIEHAIFARRARSRYIMPLTGRLFVFLYKLIPEALIDFAKRRMLGLQHARALPPKTPTPALSAHNAT